MGIKYEQIRNARSKENFSKNLSKKSQFISKCFYDKKINLYFYVSKQNTEIYNYEITAVVMVTGS